MRKILPFLFFLGLSIIQVHAQTADEVIDMYFETIGGKENIAKITSSISKATAQAQGMELPITMMSKAPNKQRMDINLQGREITQMSFDGSVGWGTNFMTMEAEAWDSETSAVTGNTMSYPDPFLDYSSKGWKATIEGEEEIEGVPCHKLKLHRGMVTVGGEEKDDFSIYFMDKENGVIIMQRDISLTGPQKGMTTETFYSDYDEVEGMFFPMTITAKSNGMEVFSAKITSMELNAEIDDAKFAMPKK